MSNKKSLAFHSQTTWGMAKQSPPEGACTPSLLRRPLPGLDHTTCSGVCLAHCLDSELLKGRVCVSPILEPRAQPGGKFFQPEREALGSSSSRSRHRPCPWQPPRWAAQLFFEERNCRRGAVSHQPSVAASRSVTAFNGPKGTISPGSQRRKWAGILEPPSCGTIWEP